METGGSPMEPTYDSNNDGLINEFDTVSNGVTMGTLAGIIGVFLSIWVVRWLQGSMPAQMPRASFSV